MLIEKGGYEANFNGEAYSSIMFQNANLSVRVTDDFMQAVERNEDWTTHWVTNPEQPGPTYPAREVVNRMAECAWHCGDPGVQYDTTINRWHTCPNSGRINASNPCSEYMFLDDTACNLASINLMKFRKPDGVFDAERFKAACRIFFIAQEILVDHASYPTAGHRPQQPPVPAAGAGLLEPRQPADERGHVLRLRRRSRRLRRGHGAAARGGQPHQQRAGRGRRSVRRIREEPRADAPRDADAPRRGRRDQQRVPGVPGRRRPPHLGRRAGRRPGPRLPQRAGHRARPHRHHQLHDGLRHHGHRAGHRPGEVQAARRRRHAQDRQPDRAARAQDDRLRRAARSARSWPTSTSTTRSKARPT